MRSYKIHISCLVPSFGASRKEYQSLLAQWWRICLPMWQAQGTWVQSLGQEDLLEQEMATHSSILAWKIP